MSRIQAKFADLKRAGRGGFIPFITAGDPDLATTELLLIELAATGADIIELGIPFSDPVADGEVIQRASERALRNGVSGERDHPQRGWVECHGLQPLRRHALLRKQLSVQSPAL